MRTNETIVVNASASEPAAVGFKVQDIYYVLFRHKWKILILSTLGVLIGVAALFVLKPKYVSEARILVKYIRETREVTTPDGLSIRSPDSRGENIINSEIDLLTSLDLMKEVVLSVGPTNIARDVPLPDAFSAAVGMLNSGLDAASQRKSSTLYLSYKHPVPEVAGLVLSNVVASYLKLHARVHTASDALADASRQVDMKRASLAQIESELRRLKQELGIVSLEEDKRALFDQMNRLTGDILATEALLAEHRAALGTMTNAAASASATTNLAEATPPAKIPSSALAEYQAVLSKADSLARHESGLLLQFRPESTFVRAARDLIQENSAKREKLEAEYPGIAMAASASNPGAATPSRGVGPGVNSFDPTAAFAITRSLEAKLAILQDQFAKLQTNAVRISANEAQITELQRRKDLEEKQYTYHYNVLEQARVNEALDQDKISGLTVIEWPTPPVKDMKKTLQIAGGLAGGGIAFALGLAFLLELMLDQSVRRPAHVERALKLPLYISVPRLPLNGSPFPALAEPTKTKALPERSGHVSPSSRKSPDETAGAAKEPPDTEPTLEESDPNQSAVSQYAEALRDRLMMYFQLHGLNHKPKLVGVTSCGKGAGVTTVASTLAASLSETGDGNVLYVNVNPERGPSAHPFHRGKLLMGIRDALDEGTRDAARVQDNLYVVTLADPNSGRVGVIPKTLAGLVPKMKASDYDYIIFDLPPVTQTSATSKVAGLLDLNFLVLESEKTQTDLARKAIELLSESRANVAAVLNKHERYMPKKFDTDL
ncbi:MAG: hypothetical protein JNK85_07155 [Verrucomicrobiales bacterium]|nr:hypothetical protein [Verrucomicrobiales bacterium]